MRIGIDLDNTLVCHDAVFHQAALERGLISRDIPATKGAVKAEISRRFGGQAWTLLQGDAYGPLMTRARAFPGSLGFVRQCLARGIDVCIVSHKSRHPALGPRHDLRQCAVRWLRENEFLSDGPDGLTIDKIEFHDTRADKIEAIRRLACDVFVDDLTEVLGNARFPTQTIRILFDPETEGIVSDAGQTDVGASLADVPGVANVFGSRNQTRDVRKGRPYVVGETPWIRLGDWAAIEEKCLSELLA